MGKKMKFEGLKILDSKKVKMCKSSDYNFYFDKETGYFERWGKTREDDPLYAPAPEILDIEVTTKCDGVNGKVCSFCYKSNTPNGKNMSLDTFKKIIDHFPPALGQVAFGADSHATSNPDLFKMMEYCREKRIIPNITVAQISDKTADALAKLCGAVAVSKYDDKDVCYDTIKRLTDRGMDQVNAHVMISEETFDNAMEILEDKLTDPRLEKLNAIVLLSLKQKGRGEGFHPLSQEKFKQIVDFSLKNNINIGFDSCSAFKFLRSVEDHPNYKNFLMSSEPCESGLFSSYISVDGEFFPCSFSENGEFGDGLDVANCDNFLKDIWNHPKTLDFRNKLINSATKNNLKCRECILFKV